MTPLDHAEALAGAGIATFFMTTSKTPLKGSHGVKDATTDLATLAAMFSAPGAALVAIATGTPSGISVLDVDRQHGGGEWYAAHRKELRTWTWRSRSGGLHLAFRHNPALRTTALNAMGRGIEIRATGASAIYWPSAGFPILCDALPAPWPDWLMPPPRPAPELRVWRSADEPRPPEHIEAALSGICRAVATSAPGIRNARLFWGASRCAEMVARGELSRRHAEAVLAECAARIGLDHIEAGRTIASAFTRKAA